VTQEVPSDRRSEYQEALSKMEAALQLLDEAAAPADIGAHLDLAINRLKQCVDA
jgi:hypothetical protein